MNLIKKYLNENNMTYKQFADLVGCISLTVSHITNDRHTNIRIKLLKKIHEVTGLSYEDLVKSLSKGEDHGKL